MYVLQHEFDFEPSYIVKATDPDAELITIAPGNYELAKQICDLLNGSV